MTPTAEMPPPEALEVLRTMRLHLSGTPGQRSRVERRALAAAIKALERAA